jgi:thiamine biosynthesis lipoprotein
VNYQRVFLTRGKAFLEEDGMRLDLGAIAKGYAVDRSVGRLKELGARHFIVDLGGNLGVYWEGTRLLDSTRATIYVRHPRREGELFGHFDVGTCGVSTSGDYQRFFIVDGTHYHHLINPRTGMPVHDMVSATVIAGNATQADALSTIVFILGRERGMELLEDLPDVEGMIVYEEGDSLHMMVSSGLKGKILLGSVSD